MDYLKNFLVKLGVIVQIERSNLFPQDTKFISPIFSSKSQKIEFSNKKFYLEYMVPFFAHWLFSDIYLMTKRFFSSSNYSKDLISQKSLLINILDNQLFFAFKKFKGETKLKVSMSHKFEECLKIVDKIVFSLLKKNFPHFDCSPYYILQEEHFPKIKVSKKEHPLLSDLNFFCSFCYSSSSSLESSFCPKCSHSILLFEDFVLLSIFESNERFIWWNSYHISKKKFCLIKERLKSRVIFEEINKKHFLVKIFLKYMKIIY